MFVPSPFANMDERHLEALIRDDFAGKAMAGILAASARLCLDDKPDAALASIRKLKRLAIHTGAELWPNHDMTFFRAKDRFPGFFS